MNSLLSERKQKNIEESIASRTHIPGALAELGVYQGGNALRMAKAGAPKKIYLFDTFIGIPEKTDNIDIHKVGDFGDTNLEEIKKAFALVNCEFRIGLFPETAVGLDETFSVVHLDADQYITTLYALHWFWNRLELGGIIILDDYQWANCPGVDKAIAEFLEEKPNRIDHAGNDHNQYFIKRV